VHGVRGSTLSAAVHRISTLTSASSRLALDTTTENCCAEAAPWVATTALSRSTAQYSQPS
jgi:hypothetical protein